MGGAVVRAIQQSPVLNSSPRSTNRAAKDWAKTPAKFPRRGISALLLQTSLSLLSNPTLLSSILPIPKRRCVFLRSAAKKRTPIVIATTGFNAKQQAEIKRLARRAPTLLSANTSLGVNVLVSLLGQAAKMLGDDYDVEIIEAHHRFKKDAPSGTALALGRSVANALNRDLDKVAINGRQGIVGERVKKEIALLSVRAGDIVGEHTVIFGGIGERLEFIHRAHSRDTFAHGALRAAQWLAKQKPGLYGMHDVLGL